MGTAHIFKKVILDAPYRVMSDITDYLGNNRAVVRAYFAAIPRFDRPDALAGKECMETIIGETESKCAFLCAEFKDRRT